MITNDIVSTIAEDKPLIYISEEAINLYRDNVKLKQENEELKSIIKEIHKTLEDNYGGLPIIEYERLIDLTKVSDEE